MGLSLAVDVRTCDPYFCDAVYKQGIHNNLEDLTAMHIRGLSSLVDA
jgi:hypothetical protein